MTTSQLIVGQLYIWHRTSLLPILHYQMRLAVSIVIQNDRLGSQTKTFFSSHFSHMHESELSIITISLWSVCDLFVLIFSSTWKCSDCQHKNKSSKDLRIFYDHLYISVTSGKQLNILEYLDRRSSHAKSCLFKKKCVQNLKNGKFQSCLQKQHIKTEQMQLNTELFFLLITML